MEHSKRFYESQIKSLQDEIAALQEQHDVSEREMTLQFGGVTQDAMLTLTGQNKKKTVRKRDMLSLLKVEIKNMEGQLDRQTAMNGVDISSCTVKTSQRGDNKVVQQHRLRAHCWTFTIQAEFEITDIKGDEDVSRAVTELNIVMEGNGCNDLAPFVSRVEERRDLLLFFRTLRRYTARCEDRLRTFQHFRDKYPTVVSLPGGFRSEVMKIQNRLLPGCALLIYWDVQVSVEGVVTPKLDLLVKMPNKALQMDQRGSMAKAPQSFYSLLRTVGPEASIENIILAVLVRSQEEGSP